MKKLIVGIGIIIVLATLATPMINAPAKASDLYWKCCLYGNPGCCWAVLEDWWWEGW